MIATGSLRENVYIMMLAVADSESGKEMKKSISFVMKKVGDRKWVKKTWIVWLIRTCDFPFENNTTNWLSYVKKWNPNQIPEIIKFVYFVFSYPMNASLKAK